MFGKLIQGRAFVSSEAVVTLYILNGLSPVWASHFIRPTRWNNNVQLGKCTPKYRTEVWVTDDLKTCAEVTITVNLCWVTLVDDIKLWLLTYKTNCMHSVPFETVRKKISFWPLQPPLRCKFAVLHLLAQWFPAWNIIHRIIITRIKTEQDDVVVCACTAWFVHIKRDLEWCLRQSANVTFKLRIFQNRTSAAKNSPKQ